jgi:hypothetical protein
LLLLRIKARGLSPVSVSLFQDAPKLPIKIYGQEILGFFLAKLNNSMRGTVFEIEVGKIDSLIGRILDEFRALN